MKHSSLSKFALMSAFTISLVTLPVTLSASAQTGTSNPDTTTNQATDSETDDDGFDWGLLGLLGLAGLAGLRKREESVAYRDPVEPGVRPR